MQAESAYVSALLERTAVQQLATRREWQALLHYRATATGWVSDIDDPRFFLSAHGKTDPEAELSATLSAFFSSELVGGVAQIAPCAFIARYRWLQAQLNFDAPRLPPANCAAFQQWAQALNAQGATLVFASAYLNNPASLFGHTLLRLDQRGQTEATRLLAYTVNYAADDSNSNVFMYAIDGLAGGFTGRFSVQPYYQLVRTYSDLESRDLWEYPLRLQPEQLQRLIEHIWELRNIEFDYYFLRENCAWQLLTLLEVANPELQLSATFRGWALPGDTIRALAENTDLITTAVARPARGSSIQRRYTALNSAEKTLLRQLVESQDIPPALHKYPPPRQALLLELAFDQRQYLRAQRSQKGDILSADPEAYHLLKSRQALALPAAAITPTPFAGRPETGHASQRLGMGMGRRAGNHFLELNGRATYHDLLEPATGYTQDAQIELLNMALRYYPQRERWRLQRLTLLDITSLPAWNALNPRPSWRIHAGWEPLPTAQQIERGAFNLSADIGLALESSVAGRSVWFTSAGASLDYGTALLEEHRAGLTVNSGVLLHFTEQWKVLAQARWLEVVSGETSGGWRSEIAQNIAIDKQLALRMSAYHWPGISEFGIGLYLYF